MSLNFVLRTVFCTSLLVLAGLTSVSAQELSITDLRLTEHRSPLLKPTGPTLADRNLVYDQPVGAVPGACVCTNLGGVSVICEDCDRETRVEYCHTHDRACQDAALQGGIREHTTFFCTTLSE